MKKLRDAAVEAMHSKVAEDLNASAQAETSEKKKGLARLQDAGNQARP